MKLFRKVIFWCHLTMGVIGGLIILTMCVTGLLLTYEKQIIAWADTRSSTLPSAGAQRLPVETILTKAQEVKQATPTAILLRSNASSPAEISFGRDEKLFLSPYSGEVLGGNSRARGAFRVITDWHRWLGAKGENRNVARAITGACNLAFLGMVMSGFYLWWPQKWSRRAVRNVTWFRRGLPARVRDLNWHNVIGFWFAIPLFIIVLSAVVISYTWASNLVYRIAGETPPAARASQPESKPPAQTNSAAPGERFANLDRAWAQAENKVVGWQSISLQIPASVTAPLTFTIDRGTGGQPQKRDQLIVDRATGAEVRWEPFSTTSPGRKLRSLLRFAHTGEVAGIAGQTIAGLSCLAGMFLVWTGLSLAWRRFRGWVADRSRTMSRHSRKPSEILPSE